MGLSGFEDVDIGETIATTAESEPIAFVEIDPPTVMMSFAVNDGPYAGTEGTRVTSREIRDRIFREARTNVSIKVEETDSAGEFKVSARGAMQVAVVVEEMRREGYEVLVSRPTVIKREINGEANDEEDEDDEEEEEDEEEMAGRGRSYRKQGYQRSPTQGIPNDGPYCGDITPRMYHPPLQTGPVSLSSSS